MGTGSNLIAVAELDSDGFKYSTFETIHAAKKLSNTDSGPVTAVAFTDNKNLDCAELFQYGAEKVLLLVHPGFQTYNRWAMTKTLESVIEPNSTILMGATIHGKELAASLSAILEAGLASDCIALESSEDGSLTASRPIYAGKAYSSLTLESNKHKICTLRTNVFRPEEPDTNRSGKPEIQEVSPTNDLVEKILEVSKSGAKKDITEARIVVSGGMGLGEPGNFKLIEDLAEVLDAAVGASRNVVDEGWRPYSNQVGQTGRTVSPDLYIACGISGAVQHIAGMSSSKCIVAINKDPYAPIFSIADYGIVGDALEILPLLTEEFRNLLES